MCQKTWLKTCLIVLLVNFAFLLHATATPVFNITPLTSVNKTLPPYTVDTVAYQVTNNTNLTRTLVMAPMAGVSQFLHKNACTYPFTLLPHASCLLALSINTGISLAGVHSGPIVCKTKSPTDNTPTPFLCAQPSQQNSLNIFVSNTASPVSLTISPSVQQIATGTTLQYNAIVRFSDGTVRDMTAYTTWGSSNTAVATIASGNVFGSNPSAGLAIGIHFGSSIITAGFAGLSANATLTVTTATLTSLTITPANAAIPNGTNQQMTAIGTFSDGSTQNITGLVSWGSSNPNVATISNVIGSQGKATSVGVGSTVISAAIAGIAATTNLSVTNAQLIALQVNPSQASIPNGTSLQYTATGIYSDGTNKDLTTEVFWTSSTSSASISNQSGSQGLALALAPGNTTISARFGNFITNATLNVSFAVLTNIVITPASSSLPRGVTKSLVATGYFSNGVSVDLTQIVEWTSSNSAIAAVSNTAGSRGVVTGVDIGTAQIAASFHGITGFSQVTVTAATLTQIQVTPSNSNTPQGLSVPFFATGVFSDGTYYDITDLVTWSSSNPSIAAISNAPSSKGIATANNVGTTTIGASLFSLSGSTSLTVNSAVLTSILVVPTEPSIPSGTTQQFTATGIYSNNSTMDLTSVVSWSSSNNLIAVISNATSTKGLALGLSQGTATITAQYAGMTSNNAVLTVNSLTIVSIQVIPNTLTLPAGYTQNYKAQATLSNGAFLDVTDQVTWSSSNTAVAVVSNSQGSQGLVTSLEVGIAQISASLNGVIGVGTLTVSPATLISIAVTPNMAGLTLAIDNTLQFTATGTFSDSSTHDITNLVTWSSSTTAASISNAANSHGLATGESAGSTLIEATYQGIIGSSALTVTNATLLSISIQPANSTIIIGSNYQYTAIGSYSDGSTQNITTSVAWSSSDTRVAYFLGNAGLLYAQNGGATTISASQSSISGSTLVTVLALGSSFEGGTVACLEVLGGTNLLAATQDNSSGLQWYNGSNVTTSATSDTNGNYYFPGTVTIDPNGNTYRIINVQGNPSGTNYAANLCHNYTGGGFTDWYLPAFKELQCLFKNRNQVGNFSAVPYWSSTEDSAVGAQYIEFFDGSFGSSPKSVPNAVRCVRAFTP